MKMSATFIPATTCNLVFKKMKMLLRQIKIQRALVNGHFLN